MHPLYSGGPPGVCTRIARPIIQALAGSASLTRHSQHKALLHFSSRLQCCGFQRLTGRARAMPFSAGAGQSQRVKPGAPQGREVADAFIHRRSVTCCAMANAEAMAGTSVAATEDHAHLEAAGHAAADHAVQDANGDVAGRIVQSREGHIVVRMGIIPAFAASTSRRSASTSPGCDFQ